VAAAKVVADLVLADRPQPAIETVAWPVPAKAGEVGQHGRKYLLGDIRRIIGLQL